MSAPVEVLTWWLAAMLSWVPLGSYDRARIPDARETIMVQALRYSDIVQDLGAVVYDEGEAPVLTGRPHTGLLMLAIARHESGFRRDVDVVRAHTDRGGVTSWCLMQLVARDGAALLRDRRECFRRALHVIRSTQCSQGYHMLAAYASGSCSRGREASAIRMRTAQSWLDMHPPPVADDAP